MTLRSCKLAAIVSAAAFVIGAVGVSSASAATPVLSVTSAANPTHFVPGDTSGKAGYTVTVTNVSSTPTDGSPIIITDDLPNGITVDPEGNGIFDPPGASTYDETGRPNYDPCDFGPPVVCRWSSPIPPGQSAVMRISIDIPADGPASVTNHVSVTGGGAPPASVEEVTPVSRGSVPFGLQSAFTSLFDADGGAVTQAGAHPFLLQTGFLVNTNSDPQSGSYPAGSPRDVSVKLPPGFVLNPAATPVLCTEKQLNTGGTDNKASTCPDAAAVGIARPAISVGGVLSYTLATPIYNMVPPPGAPAELAFDAAGLGFYIHLIGGVDAAGNYQLTADVKDIPQFGGIAATSVDLWGLPSDPSHDAQRGNCESGNFRLNLFTCPVAPTTTPFLTMPSACTSSLVTEYTLNSWEDRQASASALGATVDSSGGPLGVTGCSKLDFDPQIAITPDVKAADSPTGLDIDLKVPQTDSVAELATANLKSATVTLPDGLAVNPSAADGLEGCSPEQIGLHSNAAPVCPDRSKIGTVDVTTPLLGEHLTGGIYVAKQNDNPFGSLLAIYVTAEAKGARIKLAGHITPDPVTGRLTTTFADNPQLPFSDFKLHFDGGSRAALATPATCGSRPLQSVFSPWSAADPDHPTATESRTLTGSIDVTTGPGGGGCPDPAAFGPGFSAGVVSPFGGKSSPFVLEVTRPDGQQSLKKISVALPTGLTATLAGVPRCSQSAITPGVGGSTTCSADSIVGRVDVGAGAGNTPFFLRDQPVYLTDGYDGAPFGLAIDTHALAGPFDLGHVVVRTKLMINPVTAQVSAESEDLPSILQGIPLHIRSVRLKMNRDGFILNPTNCAKQTIRATIAAAAGATASPSVPFGLSGCSSLNLSPKLDIALTGKGQTTDNKHPGVHATVSQTAGQANLKKVVVSLPLSLALDPDNANGLCEFADGSKVDPTCPKASIVGKAVARTPILDQPLTGPVYFVKNIRKDPKSGREIRTLPKLVIPLTGENGLRLNLVGTSNVVNDRLVTTFDNIPDAPVSDFTLDIDGGKSGILVVSGTDICKATQVAEQRVDGQNGKTADGDVYLQTPACSLRVLSKKVGKTSVAVKVGGLGAGKVTVTGRGIKKTRKTISKSTVATITAKRTKGKPGKVTVSFDPAGPAKARKTTK